MFSQLNIKAMWNFEKLPESEHPKVLELLGQCDEAGLTEIHNRYNLSPFDYCCDLEPVVRHFRWAVSEGLIKEIALRVET